jgi:hypothetical protein
MSCPSCSENSSTTYSRCNPPVSTNCVFYQGKDLTCPHDESFAICKRQNMSAVQEEIFNRICQLIGDTDVTEVNIPDCLKDAWDNDDLTILNLFNFILDQQCVLKNSIDAVGTEGLTVDSLITIYNPCPTNCQCEDIPTVTIKLKDALNDMITCLCNARAQIKDLQNNLEILNQEVINVKSVYTQFSNFLTTATCQLTSLQCRMTAAEERMDENNLNSCTGCTPCIPCT